MRPASYNERGIRTMPGPVTASSPGFWSTSPTAVAPVEIVQIVICQ